MRQESKNKKMVGLCLLLVLFELRYTVMGDQVITDQKAVLTEGSEASLQCSFRGKPLQLYWLKADFGSGGFSRLKAKPLIGWYNGKTQRSGDDSGKYNLSENFSLTFIADISDAGRYYCDVSNDRGIKIGGYTDATVAAPPADPFPMIDNFTISDDNQRTTITCRADWASIGLVDLQWMHNGDLYPQINRNFTNADGTTENLTATIQAHVSEESYICVGTFKATKRVNSTYEVLVQQTLISTIPSEEPKEYLTTPIEDTDNNHSTVIAVAVTFAFLLAALTAIAVYICVKKKFPICPLRLYAMRQKEGRRQGGLETKFQQGTNYAGPQGEASVTLMTPRKQ